MLKKLAFILFIMNSFNCFSQQFKLLGSAFQTNPTTYILTTNTNNQSGMITNLYPLDLTKNFSLSFQINLGSNDGMGADGIAFMLSRNCNPSLTGGQGLGVSGTNNSIVVEFDTWNNGSFVNDISNDHIAIYRDAIFDAANNIMDGTSTPVCMASNCANTEDGQWHNVRIEWEFISSTSQKILVFFNNNLRAVSTGNHITNRFLGQSVVFYSISASTGGATNLQQVRFASNNNPTFCGGQPILLKAPPLGSGYSWSSGVNSTVDSATTLADFSKVVTCSYIDFCNTFQTVNFDITVNTSIFNPSSAQNVCLNKKPFAFSVNTNASDTNFISFVYFTQKKTDSNVYNGGTFLGNASPFNGFAAYDPPFLGNSGSLPNVPGTYFVYAIASPKPANPNCRPFEEIIINVLPHRDTFFNTSICIGQSFKGRTTSGIYNDTIFNGAFNGCDSIISFSLVVNDTTKKDSFLTICKNQPIVFNEISRDVSGIYRDTLLNSKGCDSFVYLHLTVNDTTKKDSFLTICKNQPIVFNGISRNISGIYQDTLVNSKGCDSFVYLHLTVNDTTKKDSFLTICKNQPILFNGISRNVTGIYRDTLINSKGCDSFVYLHLTVNDTTKKDSFLIICKNQPIVFNGISRNVSGIYRDTLMNSNGCDSFVYLHLTVNDTIKKDSFLTICKNQSIVFNGISRNISGIYRDTLINSNGCDSFVYLHLTVNDTTKKDSFLTICKNQPILFNGISRNISGIYRDTLLNSKGCDSFLYLHLMVNDTTKKDSFLTLCKPQTIVFNGIIRNATGIYRDTLVNSKGCDSFVYLHLTVNDTTSKDSFFTTCKNQPIVFNGISRNVSGIYRDTLINSKGCDSFVYLHLTVNDTTKKDSFLITCKNQPIVFNGISRNISGIYRDTLLNSKGCDSFVYLHLTVNDTTKKDSFLTICKNQPIVFNGLSRNITGIHRDTLVNSKGCDSFLYLHLTVNDTTKKDSFLTLCKPQTIVFNGIIRNATGIYRDTLVNSKGCDSFIYLHLTVNDTTKKDSFLIICKNQPIVFNGISRNISGIYRDTLLNSKGCDSFVYLHLTVNDTTKKDSFFTICKNQSIVFNGISRNVTGIYRDTLVNSKGCDSFIYLHLTVIDTTKKDSFLTLCKPQTILFNGIIRNATGIYRDTLVNSKGCDSFMYLHLTINDTTSKDSFFTTCKNQPIVFNGISRNVSGIYRDTLVNSKGCDSFVYLHLTVNDTTKKDSFLITCKNQPIVFNGISRNISGIYRDTLVNSKGCDSFVYLHLTVNDTTKKDTFLTICKNQPILFNGISRNISGIYRDTLLNSKGCDSFLYLHLTVNDTTKKDSFLTLCTSQSVIFNGISRNVTGIYRDTLINSKGCDSFMYLHLTINDTTSKDSFFTTCKNQPIVFNGISRNVSGIYRDTLLNSKSCDSFVYLHLTVNDTTKKDSFFTTCKNQPIVFNGIIRNISGIYRDTLMNSKGCDSFVYLHLTVNDTTKKDSFLSICSNQSVLFNGNQINTTGIYKDTLINSKGCDSFMYLHLTVNLSTNSFIKQTICEGDSFLGYSKTGIYVNTLIGANRFGCDSVRTLELIIRTRALVEFKTICENESYNGYTQTGVYKDTIIDNFGCTRFRTLNLTVANNGKIIENVTICYNDFYKGYKNEGVYFDTFISENGCTQINELRLSVRNKPLKPINDVSICEGNQGSINADQGMILYTWQDGSTKPSLEVNAPGIYYLVVMDSFKCVDFDTIIVNQLPNPDIKININSNDVYVNEEVDIEAIILDASSLGALNWKSINTIICDTCIKTKIKVEKSAWLYLNFTSQNQCKLTDSIFIDILSSNQNILEFPDAFSPNKDLLNDSYGPDYKNIKQINWQIFNRWGEKVFESNSPSYRWDGYYKSELQISNYFVLICEAIFNDGSKKRISKRLLLTK